MLTTVRVKEEHIWALLTKDPTSEYLRKAFTPRVIEQLEGNPHALTVLYGGEPIAMGGVTVYWEGRGEVWAIIDQKAGGHMVGLHRLAKDFIESLNIGRIEATVRQGFEAGHRWMRMLGFEMEARCMRGYDMDGKNCALYSKVRA